MSTPTLDELLATGQLAVEPKATLDLPGRQVLSVLRVELAPGAVEPRHTPWARRPRWKGAHRSVPVAGPKGATTRPGRSSRLTYPRASPSPRPRRSATHAAAPNSASRRSGTSTPPRSVTATLESKCLSSLARPS